MLSFRKLWQIIWYIPSPLLAGKSTIPGPQTANQKEHPKHEHFGGGGASVSEDGQPNQKQIMSGWVKKYPQVFLLILGMGYGIGSTRI